MRRKLDRDYLYKLGCDHRPRINRSELIKHMDGVIWTQYPAFLMDWNNRELYSDSDKSKSANEFVPGVVRYEAFPSLSDVFLFIADNRSNLVLYSLERYSDTGDYLLRCCRNTEFELIG